VLFDKRDPKSAPAQRAETDSRAKFGKDTIAGAYRNPKWVSYYSMQADLGRAQALLRHTRPRLRYTHPWLRLKQQLLTSRDYSKTEPAKMRLELGFCGR
jgi:hypothetical protein